MNQENKIDFITTSEDLFYESNTNMPGWKLLFDFMSELSNPLDVTVLCMVTIAYMRINATKDESKLHIPANASFETLEFNQEQNLLTELFAQFKIICEANAVLGETAAILEPHIISPINEMFVEQQADFFTGYAHELLESDWSESGFGKRDCNLYVRDDLIWDYLVYNDTRPAKYYKELYHLAPLLNIKPEEKQLCTPILYINYITNLFEQLGWDTNSCEDLVNKYLDKITAIQVDPLSFAIQSIQTVLLGSNKQLISKADDLATIYNKVHEKIEDGFDVIFLPEVYYNSSIPDVGTITIGNIAIEKKNNLYYVAFLYNMLSDKGRMLVRFSRIPKYAESPLDTEGKLLAYFVDNNLIEAMIQTENCVYMLIDKNRPETKHGKILFYYLQHFGQKNANLVLSIEEYSCEYIKLRHGEGVCIVSNQEIRLNDYCLLPKKYIFDFDRVKQQVETDMMHRILHEANPRISDIETSLKYLGKFLNKYGLDEEPYQEKLDEDDNVPSAKDVIDGCRADLLQLQEGFAVTKRIVLESFDKSNFNPCDLNKLFSEISKNRSHKNKKYCIQIDGSVKSSPIIDKIAFRDMIENIIRNAEEHGFKNDRTDNRIIFDLSQKGSRIVIKCLNNGEPLPTNFTKDKLFSKGDKGPNSLGMGLGGERIDKILAVHDAGFDVLPIGKLPQGFTVGFEITLAVKRDTNEQG